MRKIIGLLFAVFLLSMASASVSDVSFEELPTAWETGEDLEFVSESSGSNLDRIYFQSREPGEPGFTDRESKLCTVYTSCDWSFQHTEEESRTFEYRFWVESLDGDEEDSDTQQVTYYNNIDYSIEWTNPPPETSSQGSQVSMSVTARDSAGRFNTEGILHLQYRDDGNWESFDTRRCSNSYSSETCSNQGTTTLDSEKIEDGTARFRGKVVFKGDVTETTSTASTSVGEQGRVDFVDIDNLPDEAEDGTSFEIRGDAEGESLQMIYIQQRELGESGWTDWRSRSCGGSDSCEISRSYEVDGTGEREFRAYAEAPGDSRGSNPEYVDFIEQEPGERVDSVILDELPDRSAVDSEIEVTGTAEGENLDEIVLKTKERYEDWNEVESEGCSGDECDFNYEFETSETGELSFKLVAIAGQASRDSNIEVVDFYQEEEFRVDNVDLDNLPDEHPTGEDLEITGEADGENLERLILQKRDPGDDWEPVETEYCGESSSCEFDDTYQQDDEEEVDFRLRAEAGEDSENSNRETVEFQDEVDDEIDSVNIDDLPSEHPVDEDLEISGEADGENLETLTIQERDSDEDDWDDWRSEDCNGDDYCEIERDFSTGDEEEKDFRIKAETDEDTDYSDTESVEFVEDTDDRIDSVSIDNLPEEYSTDTDLEISGEADGESLDRIIIQERDPGEDWDEYQDKDCDNDDHCEISRDFSTSVEEEKNFRIKIEAGGDSDTSSKETVEFVNEEGEIDSIDINNLPSEVEEGESFSIEAEATGENLQTLYIQQRDSGESGWTDWRSTDCEGEEECSLTRSYTVSGTGEKDFRAYVETVGDSDASDTETVDFIPRTVYQVDSVVLDEIPDQAQTGENIEVTGEAEGSNLDEIVLKTKKRYGSWEEEASESCSGGECSFEYDFETSETGYLSFRLTASSNGNTRDSNIEVVDFYEEEEFRVESVSIDDLPDTYQIGENLAIEGEATGENLETVELQKRDEGGEWQTVETVDCFQSSSCEFDGDYQHGEEEEVDFRLRAEAGTSEEFSGVETVEFQDDDDNGGEEDETVEQVSIDNLPAEHPVGNALQISGDASGENLDSITVQIRDSGGSWSDHSSENCNDNSYCAISSTYTAGNSGETDFRIRAEAGDDSDVSSTETVEFYTETGISTINIDELPDSELVGTTVEVSGSMTGENLDSLEIQRKYRYSSWSTVSSTSCSGTSCSLSTDYAETEEGSTSFRLRGTAGASEEFSGIETIEYSPQTTPEVTDVNLESIPSEVETGHEVDLEAEAFGEDLDNIEISYRINSGSWNTLESGSCSGESCSLDSIYSSSTEQSVDFRAKAEAGGDTGYSEIRSTEFVDSDETGPDITELDADLESTPGTKELGSSVLLQASGAGENLEELDIQARNSSDTSWSTLETEDCSGMEECSASHVYTAETPGEVFFRSQVSNGTDSAVSTERSTVFYVESIVNSVNIDELVDEHPVDQELEVSGDAEGENLGQLVLQVKEGRYGNWEIVESTDCSGQVSCSLSSDYVRDSEGESSFRFYATAGGEKEYSGIEVVNFQSEESQEIQASIGDLPGDHPTGESLDIEGWAEGDDLEDIEIQSREEDGSWQVIDSSSCSGDYCSIDTLFTEEDEVTRDFRVRVFSEDEQDTSDIETVVFEDGTEDGGNDPYVSDVEIENLPAEYETDEELEIDASATGRDLDSLAIQQRERYESWDDIHEEDCDGDDECEAETDFETSDEGEVEFRAVAEAGSDTRRSGIEVVDFLDEDRDREEDSNLWVKVEDDEGDDLEDARVRVRNGDSETGYTDRDGEVDFELDPDDYDVIASKPGYATEERDIEIEEEETRSIRFRLERVNDFSVSASHEGEICRGEDLEVEVEVTNFDDDEESFEISGEGLGGETDTKEVEVDEDETETVTLIFRDVEDVDGGDFTVRVEDTVIRTLSRNVDVNDCVDREPQDRNLPQGLSARVDPGELLTGERVRVSGDVQGVNRPVDVTVESGGFERTVSSTRSGGYSVFFTPGEPGVRNVEISAGGFSTERQVRVLPRASVARVEAPGTVVEGEEFEICGEVNSDVDAEVMLFREDEKLDSKLGSGNVCFETEAGASGEKRYRIQASTYGQTGSAVKRIEVLEAGEEFDRFPGQITVEKTEPGQAKVELYNQGGNVARYSLEVEDIDSSWVSQTADNVVLRPGERETVYLYFSPGRSGDFNPEVVVERDGEEAFRKQIGISSQDTGRGRSSPGILDLLF
jgi:hypothetical protein